MPISYCSSANNSCNHDFDQNAIENNQGSRYYSKIYGEEWIHTNDQRKHRKDAQYLRRYPLKLYHIPNDTEWFAYHFSTYTFSKLCVFIAGPAVTTSSAPATKIASIAIALSYLIQGLNEGNRKSFYLL